MKKILPLLAGMAAFIFAAVPVFAATFTMDQIAAHNKPSDCYVLIKGKVYDVTAFADRHPGGADNILNNCGLDATEAFNTKAGRGQAHSPNAVMNLENYYIGDLVAGANQGGSPDAPKSGGESTMSVNVKYAENSTVPEQPVLTSRYPLLLPIFLGWLALTLTFSLLGLKYKQTVNKLLLMRITSLTMLVCFLAVGTGGVYMAFFGRLIVNGLDAINMHVYFGFAFVLAALSHIWMHDIEIINYIKKIFNK